jgi:hypothetical protein
VAECGWKVIVVDGSPPNAFARHHEMLAPFARHSGVDRRFGNRNDKVNGIHTGIEHTSGEKIILADDDVRYRPNELMEIAELLDRFEVVRPQNYLAPRPWWAWLEAARMLINRACLRTGDYPGTCAFRRSTFRRVGAYDGDVLFDNEEMIRHLARAGAGIRYAIDFFVQKHPPSFRKWLEQRPRQAYEDFPLRAKTAFFLSLAPSILTLTLIGATRSTLALLLSLGAGAIALALRGRQRGRAAQYFPIGLCFLAPLWVLERSLSSWWALYWFIRHGGYPFGDQILTKGVGRDWFAGGRIAAQQFRG